MKRAAPSNHDSHCISSWVLGMLPYPPPLEISPRSARRSSPRGGGGGRQVTVSPLGGGGIARAFQGPTTVAYTTKCT